MLEIRGISKVYRAGDLTQQALDGVSLSLRDSEFVAILGQSGSGKTTLLNIIGGLDRYDEGDLIINGVSTKKYRSRDWDAYRNHSVGFVFQSYNLIPHQSILANVELALTISGVSKGERRRRAKEALEKVGLGEHVKKRPSQLSGGQMQRVAIARALVNDPDILLADEPTGALDSDTSIQVMDLLKEVARDRLVVMVTHNPELAQQYATRIVTLKDGRITDDSDPFLPAAAAIPQPGRRMGKASMSFLTALALSFRNLWTKKARTILVAFAGSIGIIGIAMILSLSNGVDRYIQSVEEETLQSYPLQITDTSLNMASMMAAGAQMRSDADEEEEQTPQVREIRTVTNLFSRVSSNDLASLRDYLESGESDVYNYVQAIEYDYSLTPQIYKQREDGSVRRVNPDNSFAALGFSSFSGGNSLLSAFSSTDSFHALPASENLYRAQYELKAGHWPQNSRECVLVLTAGGRVSDLTLYALGLKDPRDLEEMIRAFAEGQSSGESETGPGEEYAYEDFLGLEFTLLPSFAYYVYDEDYAVWTDRSEDQRFLKQLLRDRGEPLTLVGVVQPGEDATLILTAGINYPAGLTLDLMQEAAGSDIVQAQLADRETDVFTGLPFGEKPEAENLELENLFSVDEEAIAEAFSLDESDKSLDFSDIDLSAMDFSSIDLSSSIDPGNFSVSLPSLSQQDISDLLGSLEISISREDMESLFASLLNGFLDYSQQDPATDYRQLPESLETYFQSEQARQLILARVQGFVSTVGESLLTTERIQLAAEHIFSGYPAWLAENPPETDEEGQPDAAPRIGEYLASETAQALISAEAAALQEELSAQPISTQDVAALVQELLDSYESYAQENELPEINRLGEAFTAYLDTDEARALIGAGVEKAVNTDKLEEKALNLFAGYSDTLGSQISAMLSQVMGSLSDSLVQMFSSNMESLMESVSQNLMDSFKIDPEALASAFTMNLDGEELRDLMSSLLSREESSYEGNLTKLGYADQEKPSSITIYPVDFDGKTAVKNILNRYNDARSAAGEEEKVISYTDVVDTLMSSVTDIVNAISYVLIAFVAISLVVSSVMIGVITYISVLERRKEIGILRAIGASKRNISSVFNAETFIIGGLAGVFGIGITLLLLIPANAIIRSLTDVEGIRAALPPGAAVVLILLSIVLTLIGGLIPSRKAAKSDPVAALRSE